MKKLPIEHYIVTLLFVAVLVTFSFAQKDSKKLDKLYSNLVKAGAEQSLIRAQSISSENSSN
jgi:hypothetical protein